MPNSTEDATAPVLPLADWLSAQEPGRALVSGTGHLVLTAAEEARIAAELERRLDELVAPLRGRPVTLATGLAPGADLVFIERLPALLARRGIACEIAGLLPVPVDVLWQDWLARVPQLAPAERVAMRERFDAARRACRVHVRLWDRSPDWEELAERQAQYRHLAAVLATRSDLLVAALRRERTSQPGGTAEVVAWRRNPASLPPVFAPLARADAGSALVVIDPAVEGAAEAGPARWLERAREALASGNALLSYDRVLQAEAQGQSSDALEYVRLLALANAGSTRAALRRLAGLPAALRGRNEDWLSLEGRLHKDLGALGGPGAAAEFRAAAEAYFAAYQRTGGTFSGINAATTRLLAGDTAAARALALEVLDQLDNPDLGTEAQRYYRQVTEAEAALLLGQPGRAARALAAANGFLAQDITARSRTLQQLRRVARASGQDESVLQGLALPPVVYVPPPGLADPAVRPGPGASVAFAGLTEPRELEAIEALLRHGLRVHAVLAAPRLRMIEHWRVRHGADRAQRLDRLLDRVHDTSVALGFLESEDRWCDDYVAAMALGLSRLTAQRLGCGWQALGRVPPGLGTQPPPGPAGGAGFQRRFAGVIFADFAGFSRLPDRDLPAFWSQFMAALAARLEPHRGDILFRHTWGDALHVVTASARSAAAVACDIHECVDELRHRLPGTLPRLELRLSAHYAPVFGGLDPVEGSGTFFGTQLSFTARIEPVTPPGMIFVTEALAARLALECPEEFGLEYAGELELAKAYGRSRLFALRRRGAPR